MWNIIQAWLWNGFILYNFAQLKTPPGWKAWHTELSILPRKWKHSHRMGASEGKLTHYQHQVIYSWAQFGFIADWLIKYWENHVSGLFSLCFYVLHSATLPPPSLFLSFVCLTNPILLLPLLTPASAFKILLTESEQLITHATCPSSQKFSLECAESLREQHIHLLLKLMPLKCQKIYQMHYRDTRQWDQRVNVHSWYI